MLRHKPLILLMCSVASIILAIFFGLLSWKINSNIFGKYMVISALFSPPLAMASALWAIADLYRRRKLTIPNAIALVGGCVIVGYFSLVIFGVYALRDF